MKKPVAYIIWGIICGQHKKVEVKLIEEDEQESWKYDDGCLGEYWSGNTPLYE